MKIITFWSISGGRKYNNSSFVSTKCIFPFLMLSSLKPAMSKNEQPSNENCYFLGAHLGFREALGRHWGGQGGHGLVLGLLWVSLAFLGGFWGLARGVLETQKGLFFTSMLTWLMHLSLFQEASSVHWWCIYQMLQQKISIITFHEWKKSYTTLASRKCYHNKSVYPCASVVATVVRIPRSEVSERHRAGSWVWVVAKTCLEIW